MRDKKAASTTLQMRLQRPPKTHRVLMMKRQEKTKARPVPDTINQKIGQGVDMPGKRGAIEFDHSGELPSARNLRIKLIGGNRHDRHGSQLRIA